MRKKNTPMSVLVGLVSTVLMFLFLLWYFGKDGAVLGAIRRLMQNQ